MRRCSRAGLTNLPQTHGRISHTTTFPLTCAYPLPPTCDAVLAGGSPQPRASSTCSVRSALLQFSKLCSICIARLKIKSSRPDASTHRHEPGSKSRDQVIRRKARGAPLPAELDPSTASSRCSLTDYFCPTQGSETGRRCLRAPPGEHRLPASSEIPRPRLSLSLLLLLFTMLSDTLRASVTSSLLLLLIRSAAANPVAAPQEVAPEDTFLRSFGKLLLLFFLAARLIPALSQLRGLPARRAAVALLSPGASSFSLAPPFSYPLMPLRTQRNRSNRCQPRLKQDLARLHQQKLCVRPPLAHLTLPDLATRSFTGTSTIGVFTKGPASDALVVALPSTSFSVLKQPFNILTTNGPDPSLPYLGAAQVKDPLKTGAGGSAFLTATVQGAFGSLDGKGTRLIEKSGAAGPAALQTSYMDFSGPYLGESKIWIIDCKRKFYTDWINKDGAHFPATFFYYPR